MLAGLLSLGRAAAAHDQLPIDAAALLGRHDSMVVLVRGQPFGWQTSQLIRTADGFRVVEQFSLGEFVQQRTEILLGKDGTIRWVQRGGTVNGVTVHTSLEYRRGRVRGVSVAPVAGAPMTLETDKALPAGTIDENAIALYLPTLPWALGAKFSFNVFSGDENAVRPMTLTVLGTATVTLASGSVEAWEIQLDGGPATVRYYMTRSEPHRMARMDLLETGWSLLLVN